MTDIRCFTCYDEIADAPARVLTVEGWRYACPRCSRFAKNGWDRAHNWFDAWDRVEEARG